MNPNDEPFTPSCPNTNSEPANAKLSSLFTMSPRNSNSLLPIPNFSTNTPNANCSPSPHKTVFSCIALRAVENRYASPSSTAMPSTPANLAIQSPLQRASEDEFLKLKQNAPGRQECGE